jgi:hypothetical protein
VTRQGRPGVARRAAVGLVDRDAVQPGEEPGVALEATDAPPGADERLLRDLLGLVAVVHEAKHHDLYPVGVPADELFEAARSPCWARSTSSASTSLTDRLVKISAPGARKLPDPRARGLRMVPEGPNQTFEVFAHLGYGLLLAPFTLGYARSQQSRAAAPQGVAAAAR